MTREEEIMEKARAIALNWEIGGFTSVCEMLVAMAKWADEHPKNPWISVKDRLPEQDLHCEEIPVLLKNGYWFKGYYSGDMWHYYDECGDDIITWDVTYWMPIPETPKGGEE